jgi:hypothetical protein
VGNSYAQFEHKMTAYVFVGVPFFKKAGDIQGQNIFNGYSPIPALGFGINYNLSTKLSIGANINQLITKKANYTLSNTNVGVGVKYNFVPMDKKISPFVYMEGNMGYLIVSQKANSTWEYPVVNDPNHVEFVKQLHNYPKQNIPITYLGAMVGVGLDFTLKLKYGLFVSANYMFTNASNTVTCVQNFEDNTSKFNFIMIQTGLRFSFGKSKSLY